MISQKILFVILKYSAGIGLVILFSLLYSITLSNSVDASQNTAGFIAQSEGDDDENNVPTFPQSPSPTPPTQEGSSPTTPTDMSDPGSVAAPEGETPENGEESQDPLFEIPNFLPFTNLADIIDVLIQLVFFLVGLAFFVNLLIGGFQWISAGGDPKALDAARGRITNALVGLLIVVAAFAVVMIIQSVFGISITSGFKFR